MIACLGAVQPGLPNNVGFNFMAVMAAGWAGAIVTRLVVAGVADCLVFFELIVAVLPMNPVRSRWNPAAIGTKMAFIASWNPLAPFFVKVMTLQTRGIPLAFYRGTVKGVCLDILSVVPRL